MSTYKTQPYKARIDDDATFAQQLKELRERFQRLVWQLGFNNIKGTDRYTFEVEFSYAVHEATTGPKYIREKMLDRASGVIGTLVSFLKSRQQSEGKTPEVTLHDDK